jgi:hypothetical protein
VATILSAFLCCIKSNIAPVRMQSPPAGRGHILRHHSGTRGIDDAGSTRWRIVWSWRGGRGTAVTASSMHDSVGCESGFPGSLAMSGSPFVCSCVCLHVNLCRQDNPALPTILVQCISLRGF